MISTPKVPGEPLKPTRPGRAIKLNLHADAKPLPNTGGLLVERQVGRGRIVVSAMQLSERDLINWRSGFESLFNACLLRRPPRKYQPGYFGDVDAALGRRKTEGPPARRGAQHQAPFFARDLGVDTAYHYRRRGRWLEHDIRNSIARRPARDRCENIARPRTRAASAPGTTFSATADAARAALREAAGVEVPGAEFVVLCLAAYLVALVPLNWLVFRTLGRVEWAWIAAPIIALAGTWVDRAAGPARYRLRPRPNRDRHPRAAARPPAGAPLALHALYTSLSTTYDFQFANIDDADRPVSQPTPTFKCSSAKASPASTSNGTTTCG